MVHGDRIFVANAAPSQADAAYATRAFRGESRRNETHGAMPRPFWADRCGRSRMRHRLQGSPRCSILSTGLRLVSCLCCFLLVCKGRKPEQKQVVGAPFCYRFAVRCYRFAVARLQICGRLLQKCGPIHRAGAAAGHMPAVPHLCAAARLPEHPGFCYRFAVDWELLQICGWEAVATDLRSGALPALWRQGPVVSVRTGGISYRSATL